MSIDGRDDSTDPTKRIYYAAFVAAGWLTLTYFIFIVMDQFRNRWTGDFDFMPITAGIPCVWLGWRAVRLDRDVRSAVAGLEAGAGLVVLDEGAINEFESELNSAVSWWGCAVGVLIALIMAAIFYLIIKSGLRRSEVDWQNLVLAPVMIGAGVLMGSLLGRLAAFGQLFRIMRKHRIQFAGLSTPAARDAIRRLESVFQSAMLFTNILCLWFAAWWVAWHVGYREYEYEWKWPFLTLWGVSYVLYLATTLWPALAFRRGLDRLYGGYDIQHAFELAVADAKEDLAELERVPQAPPRRQRAEIAQQKNYIADLEQRRFRSWLFSPYVLFGLAIWNVLLIVVPSLFGR
jgi:hypothetical protein